MASWMVYWTRVWGAGVVRPRGWCHMLFCTLLTSGKKNVRVERITSSHITIMAETNDAVQFDLRKRTEILEKVNYQYTMNPKKSKEDRLVSLS